MPPQAILLFLILALGASLVLTKLILDHRRAELELRKGTREGDNTLTQEELVALIKAAVKEETTALAEQIVHLEERLEGLHEQPPGAAAPLQRPDMEAEEGSPSKTVGRSSRPRTRS